MIKKYFKIFNDSDSYRKVNKHNIAQKQFPMLTVINKVMTKYIGRVNKVIPPN